MKGQARATRSHTYSGKTECPITCGIRYLGLKNLAGVGLSLERSHYLTDGHEVKICNERSGISVSCIVKQCTVSSIFRSEYKTSLISLENHQAVHNPFK